VAPLREQSRDSLSLMWDSPHRMRASAFDKVGCNGGATAQVVNSVTLSHRRNLPTHFSLQRDTYGPDTPEPSAAPSRSRWSFLRESLRLVAEKRGELFQARDGPLASEQHQHLEKTWTGRPPCYRDAGGVDKWCRFDVLLFRRLSHRRFHM
jgi:hypothetical protein